MCNLLWRSMFGKEWNGLLKKRPHFLRLQMLTQGAVHDSPEKITVENTITYFTAIVNLLRPIVISFLNHLVDVGAPNIDTLRRVSKNGLEKGFSFNNVPKDKFHYGKPHNNVELWKMYNEILA